MKLPNAPAAYDRFDQSQTRSIIESDLNKSRKSGENVELAPGEQLILRSPNGARWSITVSNAGALSATAL